MPATPLPTAERFSALDGLEIIFVPVIAAADLVPTRAEIDAGTALRPEVAGWDGFTTTSESIETPDLTGFVGKIKGRTTAEDSELRIYADLGGDDARDVLPRNTRGFLVWADAGDVTGAKADVYPIQVNSLAKVRSMDEPTVLRIAMSMTREPAEDITLPATV